MSQRSELVVEVLGLIAAEAPAPGEPDDLNGWLARLCRAVARCLAASGAGLSLVSPAGGHDVIAASDARARRLEEEQYRLGEGPCLEAYADRRPVLLPDLAQDAALRWPGYTHVVLGLGVRAVFAFPLQSGAARLGVLDVYRDQVGPLSAPALARAITFAEVGLGALLDGQARAGQKQAAEGVLTTIDNHASVHQAQGKVMVELGVSLADAMAWLRARAYAQDRPLDEVARDVLAVGWDAGDDDRRDDPTDDPEGS